MTQGSTDALLNALIQQGKITPDQAMQATHVAQAQAKQPLQVLVETQAITTADAIRVAAEQAGLEFVELTDYNIDGSAASLISGDFAKKKTALPIGWRDGKLLVAVKSGSAMDLVLKDDLQRMTKAQVQLVVATKSDILAKMSTVFSTEDELSALTQDLVGDEADDSNTLENFTEAAEEAPIIRYVNLIITQAITERASDIHLEPTETHLRVRYRIDGVLHERPVAPRPVQAGIISRLKIMAEINIAERRIPQDGRLSVNHQGKKIDLRVATLPTVWGEKVVMRILDNSNTRLELSDLGFSQHNFEAFRESYTKPYGMILVTGPTGSGKSTTLYATLNQIARPEVNVITVEDPVEYRIPGINQVQVNVKAGLTFAAALRSILRSDPDIVLIGEIRDHETAQIAIEASLTGHLVLSTLHTNDSPSAITRLTEMNIEPFLVGSAIDSVLAQRLARRLCEKCKEPYTPEPGDLTRVRFPWEDGQDLPVLHRPVGCQACSNTGYKGRMALHEVMTVNEDIERLAVQRSSADEIGRTARAAGMRTLRDDGWAKVLAGHTSIKEILRVVV